MALRVLVALLLCLQACVANVEKTIFLGPGAVNVPLQHPTLEDLHIDVLSPGDWKLRTHIEAEFPNDTSSQGKASWFLLDHLKENQRYEVRICWAATQPTAFALDTYELSTVWDTPELAGPLAEYAWARRREAGSEVEQKPAVHRPVGEREASVLFLRVLAAADYFTTNATLMSNVPPVYVDIILDPFIFNVLPRSLVPTVGYIVVVAIASFFAARFVVVWIQGIVASDIASAEKKQQ